jgi:hypothetical protein
MEGRVPQETGLSPGGELGYISPLTKIFSQTPTLRWHAIPKMSLQGQKRGLPQVLCQI